MTGTTCELVEAVLAHRLEGAFVCGSVDHPDLDKEAVFHAVLAIMTAPSVRRPVHGRYAEYAIAKACRLARKPAVLSDIEAASVPVAACTAHQMLSHHAAAGAGQTVLVLGGAGNVGAYAVQLARLHGARVIAAVRHRDLDFVRTLGVVKAVAAGAPPSPRWAGRADVVIDTVGGEVLLKAFDWPRPGGMLVSAVAEPDPGRGHFGGPTVHRPVI